MIAAASSGDSGELPEHPLCRVPIGRRRVFDVVEVAKVPMLTLDLYSRMPLLPPLAGRRVPSISTTTE